MNDDMLRAKVAAALRAAADALECVYGDLRAEANIAPFSITYEHEEHMTLRGAYSAARSHNAVWGDGFPCVRWGVAITVQDVDLDAEGCPLRDVWAARAAGGEHVE